MTVSDCLDFVLTLSICDIFRCSWNGKEDLSTRISRNFFGFYLFKQLIVYIPFNQSKLATSQYTC